MRFECPECGDGYSKGGADWVMGVPVCPECRAALNPMEKGGDGD